MLPELIIIGTAFVLLFTDLFLTERRRIVLAPLALFGIAAATAVTLYLMPGQGEMLGGRFAVDSVSWWFKLVFLLSGLLTVAISMDLFDSRVAVKDPNIGARGEFYTILLFSLAGAMYLISARDIVTLYVSLELATIPLYILAAWKRDSLSGEAGLKYVILGALSSGLLLYGLGLMYGLTGETHLDMIGRAMTPAPAFWLAAAMITAGVGFKLTIVPFHMWAAEVYQGAPTPVTAYLSVASKAAGLALMFQLFYRAMGQFLNHWSLPIALFAALTMTLGNVVAVTQQNIKRFMAFSAISQAGYLIMGFLGTSSEGVPAMLFYMLVYIVTNLAVFAVIMFYSNQTGREEIKDYRGLARVNPLVALAMMVGLFSLAGIPPLAGFVGKFFLFSVASKAGFHWLVAVAAVNSTISLYYYLRIVRQMYIEPAGEGERALAVTPALAITITVTALSTVVMGILPVFYESVHAQTLTWFLPFIK
ncbi:MAG TPA: NADH-quinone oxidoreductase subunit N [Bdellovibrionota bacterium]|nr:NADH-quinone oxidoreductase subunit N [Bdellovibrionota bacterium]